MGCPLCGSEYINVAGQRVCPKDGHVAGYKKIDIVELLKENEKLKEDLAFYKKMWLETSRSE